MSNVNNKKMNNRTYATAARHGNEVSPSTMHPGKVVDVDFINNKAEAQDRENDEEKSENEEEDDYIKDPDYVPEGADFIEHADSDKSCKQCENEWRKGWKAAMKYIHKNLYFEIIIPPACDNCGISKKTQKCGGKCGGAARYCSVNCQRTHWKSEHSNECCK